MRLNIALGWGRAKLNDHLWKYAVLLSDAIEKIRS